MEKLHIGCSSHHLDGWINTDYKNTKHNCDIDFDATKEFPYEDESIDYIFSEHMIEHISYLEGCDMMKECYRVIKPGGKIRISTPDLKFLIELYNENKTGLQKNYITISHNKFDYRHRKFKECEQCDMKQTFTSVPKATDTFVINNFFRDWGHLFIYDEKTLKHLFESVGFSDITSHKIMESDDMVFCGLENISRMPDGFLQLETFTLEAIK
jgi:predicted SAM-dependent methyltransferase